MTQENAETAPLMDATVYTDGGCEPNPGTGGYGVVVVCGDRIRELSGGFQQTTNNRMEIFAAIAGLEALPSPNRVTLVSDSRYLVDAMAQNWARRWRANGWWRTKKERAVNADLWERLLVLCEYHDVTFKWVKGHAGHEQNERCDELAMTALKRPNLPADTGYAPRPEGAERGTLFQKVHTPPTATDTETAPAKAPHVPLAPMPNTPVQMEFALG